MKQEITVKKDSLITIQQQDNGDISIVVDHKLKQGDIIYCSVDNNKWVCIFDKIIDNQAHYFASYNLTAKIFSTHDWFRYEYLKRYATPKETSKLFEQIDKKGYNWCPSTTQLLEKPDNTLVPDVIRIFKLMTIPDEKSSLSVGDGLFIGSEISEMLLCATDSKNGYAVFKNSEHLFERIMCRLIPCKRSDLKHGDTAFKGGRYSDTYKVTNYVKILPKGYVHLYGDTAIKRYDEDITWYKIIPV